MLTFNLADIQRLSILSIFFPGLSEVNFEFASCKYVQKYDSCYFLIYFYMNFFLSNPDWCEFLMNLAKEMTFLNINITLCVI